MGSIYPDQHRTEWIKGLRPPRASVDPFRPYGFFLEKERSAGGQIVCSGGILLANRECPWHCLMCDLWKHTLSATVPTGAIPAQIQYALAQFNAQPAQLKLYNSGSFFDPAAIPPEDYRAIAVQVAGANHVIVESHPRLVGPRALQFRDLLPGTLEVAIGLETIHPEVLPRLNKRFSLDQFAAAARFLRQEGIALRAFVLVKPPFLDDHQAVEWAVKSARFAFDCGAAVVSLIPTRPGNGALEQLMAAGEFSPPALSVLEQCLEGALQLGAGRVFADTWDLQTFATCPACFTPREQRLNDINLKQKSLPAVDCPECGSRGALDD